MDCPIKNMNSKFAGRQRGLEGVTAQTPNPCTARHQHRKKKKKKMWMSILSMAFDAETNFRVIFLSFPPWSGWMTMIMGACYVI
jgi:hypothetical protein